MSTVKGTFDFSVLFDLMADIKRSLWHLDRKEERFHKNLSIAHNNYYSRLLPVKRRELNLNPDIQDLSSTAARALRDEK